MVPAFGDQAVNLVFGQVNQTHCFLAFFILAFDVEVGVHSLKRFAEDRLDVVDGSPTAIWALVIGLFGGPARDASLAEEFAAVMALVGFQDNLDADGALEEIGRAHV